MFIRKLAYYKKYIAISGCKITMTILFKFQVCLFVSVKLSLSTCQEPSNVTHIKLELQNTIRDNYMNYMSFLNVKGNLVRTKGQLNTLDIKNSTAHQQKVYVSRLYGEQKCKKMRKFRSRRKQSASEMSSCPWYYVLEVDKDRIPSTVLKAKCSCSRCMVPTRYGYKRDRTKSIGNCKEVRYYMPIIRRHCDAGVYRYQIAIENMPVGCTCKRCNRKKRRENNI